MSEADVYDSAENYESLVEALKRRAGELEISYSDLDAIAGLPAGFAGKFMGPSSVKRLGPLSLFTVLPALGLKLTLAVDPDALRRYAQRGPRRHGKQARMGNLAALCGKRTMHRALRHLVLTCSWVEILKIVSTARAAVAAEQTMKAARKAAIEANKQPRRGARQQNGKARPTSAYDAPIGDELQEIADAASIRVSRGAGERRGRKRGMVSTPFPPRDQRAINRRTQIRLSSKHAKPVNVAP